MGKFVDSRLIIILICISGAILPLYASSPQIVCRPLELMLDTIPESMQKEIKAESVRLEKLITIERMDSLMSLCPDSGQILTFTRDQAMILRFFEYGCGVYIFPVEYLGYIGFGRCNPFKEMTAGKYMVFKNMYWTVRSHIAEPFLKYYCKLMGAHLVAENNKSGTAPALRRESFYISDLLESLPLMFYWYLYEGDNQSVPPVEFVEYGIR